MSAEGKAEGRTELLAVHLFPGHVMIAIYHAASADDPSLVAAGAIRESITPEG